MPVASWEAVDRRHLEELLERAEERVRMALEAGRMGTWSWVIATDAVEWGVQMEARYGLAPGGFGGSFDDFAARIHPADRDEALEKFAAARATGADLAFEHRAVWPDGSVHWIEARGRALRDERGEVVGMVGVGIDIDARKRLEALMLEDAELRVAAAAARDLAEAERIARLGSWHWDAESDVVVLSGEMTRMLDCPRTMSGAEFRELLGQKTHPDDADLLERVSTEAFGQGQRRYATELRMVVGGEVRHIIHRGEVQFADDGSVAAVRGTAQDVTERRETQAALASTKARLARERQAVDLLQETFIRPIFPTVDGYQIGAAYLAAEYVGDIGGDWYDAFRLPDGRIMLAVGDVSGHGVGAARLMAKLRHANRAYASIEDDISRILFHLDRYLEQFRDADEIATVQLARLDPASGSLELGSAGHPPPLLVDGTHATFLNPQPRPALGTTIARDSVDTLETTLPLGGALLLYTDGLVERRTEPIDVGLERLRRADFGRAYDVDTLCSLAIDTCLGATSRRDDVCLLALRRHDAH